MSVYTIATLMLTHATPPDLNYTPGPTWPVLRGIAALVTTSAPSMGGEQIGKADLVQARELLSRARSQLEPRQWETLESKLADADRAWEIFDLAAKESGEVAAVARGTASIAAESTALRALTTAGPALIALILLWPSSTAGNDVDHGPRPRRPEALARAKRDFEAKLREVSQASQQVKSEIERKAEHQAVPTRQPAKQAPKSKETRRSKQECRELYNKCVDEGWVGSWKCYDCFRFCEAQQTWPGDRCFPLWER